jgi:hypothetical protein
MNYRVFIGYSNEDNEMAQYIYHCLGRIFEFLPYKAELYQAYGEDFKQRIQDELYASHFMVVLLTENGKNSQWVNQEIGFAYALRRRPERQYRELPHIIPISHRQVQLKGFVTKDTTDFLILDDFPSSEYVIANIIFTIRRCIPRGLEEGVLHLHLSCSKCVDEKGLPFEWVSDLPDNESMVKGINSNKYLLPYACPRCKTNCLIDVRTFLPVVSQ